VKRILIIDNTFDPPHGCPEIRRLVEEGAKGLGEVEVSFVRAPEGQIPTDLSPYDGVVLSGSKTRIEETEPWIEREMDAIRQLHAKQIPTFGICYGEQLIARTLGAQTGAAQKSEFGWAELELKGESPLFEGLPKKFHSFEYHSDEVLTLPPNLRLTASSRDCAVQAFDVQDAPMWGVQFHPERNLEGGVKSLERRMMQGNGGDRFLNKEKGAELFQASVGETIFRNFLKRVWAARR
jgi:GMP synthase (glutamine-hydrolysing)